MEGLTTKYATNALIQQLRQFSINYSPKNKLYHIRLSSKVDWVLSGVYITLLLVSMILTSFECKSLFFRIYIVLLDGDVIVMFLILLYLLIDVTLDKKLIKFQEQNTLSQLQEVIKQFHQQNAYRVSNSQINDTNSKSSIYRAFTNQAASHNLVSVLRDAKWQKIMKPLIIQRDIIELNPGDASFTKIRCVSDGHENVSLSNGQVFENPVISPSSPSNNSNRRKYQFIVQKSVFINNLEREFNAKKQKNDDKVCMRTSFHQILGKLITCARVFSFCAFVMTIILVLIWVVLTRQDQNYAYMEYIRSPIFIVFIALGIGANILMRVIDGWSQDQIQELIACLQHQDYNQSQIQFGDVMKQSQVFQRADSYYERSNFQQKISFKKKMQSAIQSIFRGVPCNQNLAVSLANTTSNDQNNLKSYIQSCVSLTTKELSHKTQNMLTKQPFSGEKAQRLSLMHFTTRIIETNKMHTLSKIKIQLLIKWL